VRYLDVCSGISAPTQAWKPIGWECAGYFEIDPFASEVLAARFSGVANYGNLLEVDHATIGEQVGHVDLLVSGSPCFVRGTLVLTERGLVPIEDVQVGDYVLTHKLRYRRVTEKMSRCSETVRLKGQGGIGAIRTTWGHPFWAMPKGLVWDNDLRRYVRRALGATPDWIAAMNMKGYFWATPSVFPSMQAPYIETHGQEHALPPFSEAFWKFVGMWVGNGWAHVNARRGTVMISDGHSDAEKMVAIIEAAGLHVGSRSKMRTATRVTVASRPVARWLMTHFGSGAENKTIPAWLFGLPEGDRQAFVDGYLFADGSVTGNGFSYGSVSRKLSVGLRLLFSSLRLSVSSRETHPARSGVIEGRVVNERVFYEGRVYDNPRSAFFAHGFCFGLVRDVQATGDVEEVWNLEVEDDNSYTADGLVVHNCVGFSVAGRRGGLGDARSAGPLWASFALARAVGARWLVWENVPGVLSDDGGRTFRRIVSTLDDLGYCCAWRVLDARFFGVPQRRRRVFVVGYLGDWRPPAAVLFEPESLRRNPSKSRKAGPRVARCVATGTGTSGSGYRSDGDTETLIPMLAEPIQVQEGRNYSKAGRNAWVHNCVPFQATPIDLSKIREDVRIGVGTCATGVGEPGDPAYTLGVQTAVQAVAYPISSDALRGEGVMQTPGPDAAGRVRLRDPGLGVGSAHDPSFTINASVPPAVAYVFGSHAGAADGDACNESHDSGGPVGGGVSEELAYSLRAGRTQSVCVTGEQTHTLRADGFDASEDGTGRRTPIVASSAVMVRRLTPTECEFLQGMPRDFTLIERKGKPAADGPRYKALGNSMAVPVMRWIGERLAAVDALWEGLTWKP
jgi:site-specific DNA-cytosine methylase